MFASFVFEFDSQGIQCPTFACPLYEVDGRCTSSCSNCGVLCESFPATDIASLDLYKSKKCTIIVGDLYITNLPSAVIRRTLVDSLGTIKTIRGVLYFQDNHYISAMTFLQNLVSVRGISYKNNQILVDARMPSLRELTGPVTVEGCYRLCPGRYSVVVGTIVSDVGCTNPELDYFYYVVGNAKRADLDVLGVLTHRIAQNVTNNEVSL
jgi:hypothetical protein